MPFGGRDQDLAGSRLLMVDSHRNGKSTMLLKPTDEARHELGVDVLDHGDGGGEVGREAGQELNQSLGSAGRGAQHKQRRSLLLTLLGGGLHFLGLNLLGTQEPADDMY